MKRLLYIILLIVGVVGLSVASSFGYNYYKDRNCPILTVKDATDSASFVKLSEQVTNPVMTTMENVCHLRTKMAENSMIDSIFLSIPPSILINVANVTIGNKKEVTKKDIVEEYMKNYDSIYRHLKLPDLSIGNPDPLPTPLAPETIRVPLPPITEVDTVINGHHVKLIKTVENG